jgi:hypothetical protein
MRLMLAPAWVLSFAAVVFFTGCENPERAGEGVSSKTHIWKVNGLSRKRDVGPGEADESIDEILAKTSNAYSARRSLRKPGVNPRVNP